MNKPVPASPAQPEEFCACGHERSKHYNRRGMCMGTRGTGFICSCRRFRKQKSFTPIVPESPNSDKHHAAVASPAQISDEQALDILHHASTYLGKQWRDGFVRTEAQANLDARAIFFNCSNRILAEHDMGISREEVEGSAILERSRLEPVEAVSTTPKLGTCYKSSVLHVDCEHKSWTPFESKVSTPLPQQEEAQNLRYATQIAEYLHKNCYPEVTQWKPLEGDLFGVLSQIDNMCTAVQRKPESAALPQQEEPAPETLLLGSHPQRVENHAMHLIRYSLSNDGKTLIIQPRAPVAPLLEQEEPKRHMLGCHGEPAEICEGMGLGTEKTPCYCWCHKEVSLPPLSLLAKEHLKEGLADQALRERTKSLTQALTSLAAAQKEIEKQQERRKHTQDWYASHYGKLEDWARKVLPEPHRNQFFSCVANGSYDHMLDVGETYTCKAGYRIVPTNYFRMETAEGQLIRDQTSRAELAESKLSEAQQTIQSLEKDLGR